MTATTTTTTSESSALGIAEAAAAGTLNAFTVDVEDYFHVSAFESVIDRAQWSSIEPRVEIGLNALLELAERADVRGSFYVLGWLAERRPDLVRKIAEAGHEIGCHSQWHRLVYSLTPDEFREDLRASLDAIEQACGRRCRLYRAPSFSITRKSLWGLNVLAEEGIEIDSSIFPVRHDRYGIAGAPRGPFRPLREHPAFVEVPPSTMRFAGQTLPCVGGGYLRLYPAFVTRFALRQINDVESRPGVLYVHPWELDPGQPRVNAGLVKSARHRVNLARTERRIERLFEQFRFGTMSEVLEEMGGPAEVPFVELHA